MGLFSILLFEYVLSQKEEQAMARLTDVQLSITVNQSNQTASIVVAGRVQLTPDDVGTFIVECSMLGDDTFRDDKLFQYSPKVIQARGFTTAAPFEFSSTEQLSILNEDVIDKDEIYAELVLKKGNEIGPVVSKAKTNVVEIRA
jgi:hypothetical protein